jgi:hypothetical protein
MNFIVHNVLGIILPFHIFQDGYCTTSLGLAIRWRNSSLESPVSSSHSTSQGSNFLHGKGKNMGWQRWKHWQLVWWYGDFPMLFIHCPIAYSKENKNRLKWGCLVVINLRLASEVDVLSQDVQSLHDARQPLVIHGHPSTWPHGDPEKKWPPMDHKKPAAGDVWSNGQTVKPIQFIGRWWNFELSHNLRSPSKRSN